MSYYTFLPHKAARICLTYCQIIFTKSFARTNTATSVVFGRSPSKVFLERSGLNISRKFIVKHPCQSAISIKLQSIYIEITFRYGCSPVNLLLIFRIPFPKNASGGLLLYINLDKYHKIKLNRLAELSKISEISKIEQRCKPSVAVSLRTSAWFPVQGSYSSLQLLAQLQQ